MFASRCKDVHKGIPACARRMARGGGRARKETINHVLDLEAIGVACGRSSAVVASRWRTFIKLSKDGET
jgi:hypothetical protein